MLIMMTKKYYKYEKEKLTKMNTHITPLHDL